MMNKDIEIGQEVTLSKDTDWDLGDDNPTGVSGVVVDSYGWVDVEWSNGGFNSYKGCDEDLIPVDGE